jgi:hypothetical protein
MKEFWDARYETEEFVYGRDPNRFFSAELLTMKPGRILLPGEGEGRNAVFAASLGWEVDAMDQSGVGKTKAFRLAREQGVEINYQVCPVESYDFLPDHYDAAGLIYVHLPSSQRQWLHARILESLKPGGLLLLEAFHTSQLGRSTGGPQSLELLYNEGMLLRDFSGLEKVHLEECQVELEEGSFHRGLAHIVRLIGRKPSN